MKTGYYQSPIGVLELKATENALVELTILPKGAKATNGVNPIIQETINQLMEYFAGKRKAFTIPFIIPCHRVIASNRSLGGYAYGLDMKKQMLDYEK